MNCQKIFTETSMTKDSFLKFCKNNYNMSIKIIENKKKRKGSPIFAKKIYFETYCIDCKIGIHNWKKNMCEKKIPSNSCLNIIETFDHLINNSDFKIQIQKKYRCQWLDFKLLSTVNNYIDLERKFKSIDLFKENIEGKRLIDENKKVILLERI